MGIKAGVSVFNQTCTALSWERIHNSNSDMSSANMKAVPLSLFPPWIDHLTICLRGFWTEPAGEEITQTFGVIYLYFNMPYKATLFQN